MLQQGWGSPRSFRATTSVRPPSTQLYPYLWIVLLGTKSVSQSWMPPLPKVTISDAPLRSTARMNETLSNISNEQAFEPRQPATSPTRSTFKGNLLSYGFLPLFHSTHSASRVSAILIYGLHSGLHEHCFRVNQAGLKILLNSFSGLLNHQCKVNKTRTTFLLKYEVFTLFDSR